MLAGAGFALIACWSVAAPAAAVRPAAQLLASTGGPLFAVVPPGGPWGWPLAGRPPVLRPFDPPAHPYGPGHRGVDLGAAPGDPVLSAGPGVVAFAGVLAGRGVVSVRHAGGLRTTYEPLAVTTRVGTSVSRGTVLGRLVAGHAGCAWAACLHWGLRRGEVYLDPLSLVSRGPVRLLPLHAAPGSGQVHSVGAADAGDPAGTRPALAIAGVGLAGALAAAGAARRHWPGHPDRPP